MTPRKPRAGAYASERARTLRGEWENRARPRARLLFWPLVAIGVIGILIARPDALGVAFGILIGAGAIGYAFLLEDVPDEVFRWERGAEGERRTEDRLRELERAGWTVVHDVQRRRSNWDHIVVGPAGVFVLETKDRRGELAVSSGIPELRIDDKVVDDDRVSQWPRYLTAAAVSLKKEIEVAEGERPWVHPVLVFWGDFPARIVDGPRVTFVHGDELVEWLKARPKKLSRGRQALIAAVLEDVAERPEAIGSDL
jgi:hypothetical protein